MEFLKRLCSGDVAAILFLVALIAQQILIEAFFAKKQKEHYTKTGERIDLLYKRELFTSALIIIEIAIFLRFS